MTTMFGGTRFIASESAQCAGRKIAPAIALVGGFIASESAQCAGRLAPRVGANASGFIASESAQCAGPLTFFAIESIMVSSPLNRLNARDAGGPYVLSADRFHRL